jgi:hypothetical protein
MQRTMRWDGTQYVDEPAVTDADTTLTTEWEEANREQWKAQRWDRLIGGGMHMAFGLTFAISWIYCIAHYGFLFGVGLGWLPSLILAAVVTILFWPLLIIIGIGLIVVVAVLLWMGAVNLLNP